MRSILKSVIRVGTVELPGGTLQREQVRKRGLGMSRKTVTDTVDVAFGWSHRQSISALRSNGHIKVTLVLENRSSLNNIR